MGLTIYASFEKDDGTCGPLHDFECSDLFNIDGIPNPKYVAGNSVEMTATNFYGILKEYCNPTFVRSDLMVQRSQILTALTYGNPDQFDVGRLHKLLNCIELGISRGAEKLVWL